MGAPYDRGTAYRQGTAYRGLGEGFFCWGQSMKRGVDVTIERDTGVRMLTPFFWATLCFLVAAQLLGLLTSPAEAGMGHLQKIMYVHVPAAWSAFIAFGVVFVSSILYLARGRESHDLLAASAAEVGVVLTGLTLALGSIWGRPTWGVWWTWDPRLTSTAVLFIIFVGYLSLRAFVEDPGQRARWSAAVGILGFLNVPIVYLSVRWWRTLHQPGSSPATVDPAYAWGLRANAVAILLVMIYLVSRRYRIARTEVEIRALEEVRALGPMGADHDK